MTAVPRARRTTERLSAFSDGVFAVLITVLVLDLRPPELPTFKSLLSLWPTWLSYAVSYLFIAIVWTNHHHLMRYATEATPRLMWFNFAHLFSVSLLPLSTAWMAVSELAAQPVAFYAAVFFLVNATYICLIYELIDRASDVVSAALFADGFEERAGFCVTVAPRANIETAQSRPLAARRAATRKPKGNCFVLAIGMRAGRSDYSNEATGFSRVVSAPEVSGAWI